MTEQEIQALIDSGDPDQIDKAIAFLDSQNTKEDVTAEPSSGKQPSTQQSANTEETDVNPASSTADVEAPKGIQSKNGEHVLPYAVLEQARQEAQEAKRQLSIAQQQAADATTNAEKVSALQQQMELMQAQLEKAGIKPAKLDDSLTFTDEELDALDEYGELGGVSKKAAKKVAQLEAQVQALLKQTQTIPAAPVAAPASTDPVSQAIAAVEGLDEVMRDPALAEKAIAIDDQLKTDPKWANQPLQNRFGEVMKRLTPVILQRDSTSKGKQAFDPDYVAPPMSLNGISTSQADASTGLEDMFKGLSEIEIQAKYMSLTPAQQAQVNEMLGW